MRDHPALAHRDKDPSLCRHGTTPRRRKQSVRIRTPHIRTSTDTPSTAPPFLSPRENGLHVDRRWRIFKVTAVQTDRTVIPGEAPVEHTDMARCTRTTSLGVYHIRTDWGNGLDNARVLCKACRPQSQSSPSSSTTPPPFSSEVIEQALKRAGHRCESALDPPEVLR